MSLCLSLAMRAAKAQGTSIRRTVIFSILLSLLVFQACGGGESPGTISPDATPEHTVPATDSGVDPKQTPLPTAQPTPVPLDETKLEPVCSLNLDRVGEMVRVSGQIVFLEANLPGGVFAQLEEEDCSLGVFVDRDYWNKWKGEEKARFTVGSWIEVEGQLGAYLGELEVQLTSPALLAAGTQTPTTGTTTLIPKDLCDVGHSLVGQTVTKTGTIVFIDASDQSGQFADLTGGGCSVGVWADQDQIAGWPSDARSLWLEGVPVVVEGKLTSFGGEVILEISAPLSKPENGVPAGGLLPPPAAPAPNGPFSEAPTDEPPSVHDACALLEPKAGRQVQLIGVTRFVDEADPAGIFLDFAVGDCPVGIIMERRQWQALDSQTRDLFNHGEAVRIEGRLDFFEGALGLEITGPPVPLEPRSVPEDWFRGINVFDNEGGGLVDYATSLDVGGGADTEAEAEMLREHVNVMHALGIAYVGEVNIYHASEANILTHYPGLGEGLAVDLDGRVPIMWKNPMLAIGETEAYWGNTLHPVWQDYLKRHVERQVDAGVDAIFFDNPHGVAGAVVDTRYNGDFNPVTLSGFREYLQETYSEPELEDLGIVDIADFDYRQFIFDNGYASRFRDYGQRWDVPLFNQFYTYIDAENERFVASLLQYAKEYARGQGRDVIVFTNIYGMEQNFLRFAPYIDGVHMEFEYLGETPARAGPVLRIAGALGLRTDIYPSPTWTNRVLIEMGQPNTLLKTWIADAYSSGAALSVPSGYAASPREAGEDITFMADMDAIDPYYRFVLEHPECCTALQTEADVALVYHAPSERSDPEIARPRFVAASEALMEANIQYNVLWLDGGESVPANTSLVVLPTPVTPLDPAEERALDGVRVVDFAPGTSAEALLQTVRETIEAAVRVGADQIEARLSQVGDTVVVNLLNTDYNIETDELSDSIEFSVDVRVPGEREISSVRLLSPEPSMDLPLDFNQESGVVSFNVPIVHAWGVVVLK